MSTSYRRIVTLVVLLLIAGVYVASAAPAADSYFTVTDIATKSCTPGATIGIAFTYETVAGDTTSHAWSLTNERTGAVDGPLDIGPQVGYVTETYANIGLNTVPAGTLPGDMLTQKVIVTSDIGPGGESSITFECGPVPKPEPEPEPGPEAPAPAPIFTDGRINNSLSVDVAAPVAVYQNPLAFYAIDPASSDGVLILPVSDETIESVGIPAVNTILAEGVNPFTGQPVTLWRLSDGKFQLNTFYADGKPYIITWEAGSQYVEHLAW